MARALIALLLLTGLVAAVVAGWSTVHPAPPVPSVATVDGRAVEAEEFRTRYIDYLLQTGLEDAPVRRAAFLERLLSIKLIVRNLLDGGLADTPAYRQEASLARRKLLLDAYAAEALFDTLQVTRPEMEALFVRVNTTLEARHLYARTEAEAQRLYARLQQGATFEALAREVFADTALANNGGALGTIGFDETDPAFEEAAFALAVGEVSPPVRTAQGYSIIRVDDRFTKPILTETEFAVRKDKLEHYLRVRKEQQAQARHVRDLAVDLAPVYEEAVLERLLASITGRAALPAGEALDALLAEPLVTFGPPPERRTWTVGDFRAQAAFAAEEQRAQVRSRDDLEHFTTGLAVQQVMLERAEARRLDRLPAFQRAYDRALEDWTYERAWDRLKAEVEVPEDSILAYYEAYGDEFGIPQTVRVWEIMAETRAEAARLKGLLAGTPFETLARVHSVRPGADATGGDLGYVRADQLGVLAEPVLAAGAGAVLGPLEVAGRYVLLRVGPRRPARPATLEEARPDIVQRLRRPMEQAHVREHARALRGRYAITVDEDALHHLPLIPES
jgi:parvulin-like peptidyl-prolyl isomerase